MKKKSGNFKMPYIKKNKPKLSEEEKKKRAKEAYDRFRRENHEKFKWMVLMSTRKYNEKNKEIIREKYLKRSALKRENEAFRNILLE